MYDVVGSFQLTPGTAGASTLSVANAGDVIMSSTPLNVAPGALDHLGVVGGSFVAGAAGAVTVTAYDAFGNVVTSANDAITLSSSDPDATFATGVTLVNGVATVSSTFFKAGTQTVTATDAAQPTVAGSNSSLNVTAGVATHLVATTVSTATAGDSFVVGVKALDAYGNTATSFGRTVHLTSTDGQQVEEEVDQDTRTVSQVSE